MNIYLATYPQNEFSTWLFAWYILYRLGWISYNPVVSLILASIFVLVGLVIWIGWTGVKNVYIVIWFIFINVCMKALPLMDLIPDLNVKTYLQHQVYYDLAFGLFLFVVYMALLYVCFGATVVDLLRVYNTLARENKPYYAILWICMRSVAALQKLARIKI